MITKFLNVLAFSPVYPVHQMCTSYIHLYNPINPSIFAGSYCRAYHFDMVFHSTEYTQMHWLDVTLHNDHTAKDLSLESCSLSGVPDYFGRNKISSGGDLSHYSSASLY